MAVGIYGNKSLASVDYNDVDILFAYSPDRQSLGNTQMQPLYNNITNNELRKLLGADGVYKLRLPAGIFNQLGFYTILIKPKSFEVIITDCSYIVTNNDDELQLSKKGIVIPTLQFQNSGSLVGYQIEYFDNNNNKIKNFHRIITSSDRVSLSPNTSSSNPASTTYTLDSNGTQLFLTLTPDEASLISGVPQASLGKGGQKILISNTFFDPTVIEIEMVDHTLKTLSYGIFGNATRDTENGIYSVFDEEGNLYKQYNLIEQKKQFTNGILEVKQERTDINLNQTFQDIVQGL